MARHLNVDMADGLLTVVMTGERLPVVGNGTDEAIESWRAITEARKRFRATRVLVIDRMTGPPSTVRSLAVGKTIEVDESAADVWCALVVEDEAVRKNVLLGARIVSERGTTAEVFATVAEALAWLSHLAPAPGSTQAPGRVRPV